MPVMVLTQPVAEFQPSYCHVMKLTYTTPLCSGSGWRIESKGINKSPVYGDKESLME